MERLLELDEWPTGVFTVNNLVALGAIEAVARQARGTRRRCPRLLRRHRVRVAALPVPDRDAQPAETFGTLAVGMLLFERIEGRQLHPCTRKVVLPADFVVRESCGAKARSS